MNRRADKGKLKRGAGGQDRSDDRKGVGRTAWIRKDRRGGKV